MTQGAANTPGLRNFDWVMIALILAISLQGLLQVYSSTRDTEFQSAYSLHAVWLGLGLVAFWLLSAVDYHSLADASPVLWLVCVAALAAILLWTDPVNGSRRWLPTPFGVSIQVSEVTKLALVLVIAKYCSRIAPRPAEHRVAGDSAGRRRSARAAPPSSLRILVMVATVFVVPFVLVLNQPDLGTALSMCPILALPLLLSAARMKHIAVAAIVALLLLPVGWSVLKPYQKSRITSFLEPDKDPRSAGYQIIQSRIAIGSGGLWGQGVAQGSQTQLRFLPTPHTDFILASLAEERGFIGVAILLALFYALLARIVQTAKLAQDPQGTLIAMSVAGLLLFHVVVNVGMVVNKLPVTGLPLPLMSYGGSSLLTVLAMLGLVNNVRLRRFVN